MQTDVLNIRNKFIYYSSQPWKKKNNVHESYFKKKTAIYIKHNWTIFQVTFVKT